MIDTRAETAYSTNNDESGAIAHNNDYTESDLRPEQIDSMLREEGYPLNRGVLDGSAKRYVFN